ncbi:hypothetical protein K2805_004506 [Salmonella enterica]|nr:hypothetical protein [Salmonella enterica]EIL4066162.1 hypothetical protein [Salmonella enterica]
MSEFTKEQLIERVKQITAINKRRINANPDATGLVMDNELFAIALAALTEPDPEECKCDGATWYDLSGRERCGMCGGDI